MPSRKYASVKFDSDFVEVARQEAHLLHRSVAGQIEHWAALGAVDTYRSHSTIAASVTTAR